MPEISTLRDPHGPCNTAWRQDRQQYAQSLLGGLHTDTYAHVTTDAQLKAAQTMGTILSRAV